MDKQISSFKFLPFFIRLIPSFIIVVTIFYIIGPFYIRAHLKLFKNEIEFLHPEYSVKNSEVFKVNQLDYIWFLIKVNKNPAFEESPAKKGATLKLKGQASSLCIAPIIVFSLILAWPAISIRQRGKAALISLPLLVALAAIDYPMIFIADIESVYSDNQLMNSFRALWKHVMNNGGRQFLALIIFLFSVLMIYPGNKKILQDKVGRNAPCSCGSGKKYKHCCLS